MGDPVAPWAELVALAERECELLAARRWDEAAALGAERFRRATALGAPPPAARQALERLLELQTQVSAQLAAARGGVLRELAGLRKGAQALRGYRSTATAAPASSRVSSLG
jgi:hypothetical protein